MIKVASWFSEWIRYHKDICRHEHWNRPAYSLDQAEGQRFFRGWISAFTAEAVTQAEAGQASRTLQRQKYGYPERHLEELLDAIKSARRARLAERKAQEADEQSTARRERIAQEAQARAAWEQLSTEEKQRRIEAAAKILPPSLAQLKSWPKITALSMFAEEFSAHGHV